MTSMQQYFIGLPVSRYKDFNTIIDRILSGSMMSEPRPEIRPRTPFSANKLMHKCNGFEKKTHTFPQFRPFQASFGFCLFLLFLLLLFLARDPRRTLMDFFGFCLFRLLPFLARTLLALFSFCLFLLGNLIKALAWLRSAWLDTP